MASKISPKLEKEVLRLAAEGQSSREIAAWLLKERGVNVSHNAVAKRLRQTRVERAEVAKAVVREKLGKSVIGDLERLEREQRRVERISKRLARLAVKTIDKLEQALGGDERLDPDSLQAAVATAESMRQGALQASDRVAKLAGMKLRLSGADEAPDNEEREAAEQLGSRIDSLAARLREEEALGEAGADVQGRGPAGL